MAGCFTSRRVAKGPATAARCSRYSAILLFCYSTGQRYLFRQPRRCTASAVAWCAYHATSTHAQHTPQHTHKTRVQGPATAGAALATLWRALGVLALRWMSVRFSVSFPSPVQGAWCEAKGSCTGCCCPFTEFALRCARPPRRQTGFRYRSCRACVTVVRARQ